MYTPHLEEYTLHLSDTDNLILKETEALTYSRNFNSISSNHNVLKSIQQPLFGECGLTVDEMKCHD